VAPGAPDDDGGAHVKWIVTTAAITVLLATGVIAATEASANTRQQETRERQCRFQWVDPGTWTAREERRTAECVVARWGVEGGLSKLIAVGDCESHWYRFANNGGSYLGIFQHAASSWLGRVRTWMPADWRLGPWTRWANPRSQIVTTVRMVNASGWSAWSCA
jgi:hypothetical protein